MHTFHLIMSYVICFIGYSNLIIGLLMLLGNAGSGKDVHFNTKVSVCFGALLVYCFHNLAV